MAMTSAERQRERRRRLKEEGNKEILVRLDTDQQEALKVLCAKCDWTVSEAVGWALENCLAKLTGFKKIEDRIDLTDEQIFTRGEDGVYRACD